MRAPPEPIAGPVAVDITFMMEAPKSWPRWKREAAIAGSYRHVYRPDVDNLVKLAKDALNGILWVDDSQVCEINARKVYSETPRTWIVIHELEQATRKEKKNANGS
jgi:Holliday junction resolvase RusA-like endonuclease